MTKYFIKYSYAVASSLTNPRKIKDSLISDLPVVTGVVLVGRLIQCSEIEGLCISIFFFLISNITER